MSQSQVSYSNLLVLIQLSSSVSGIHFNGFTAHAFDFLSKMSLLLTSGTSEQRSALARSARLAERARVRVSCERRAQGGPRSLGSLGSLPTLHPSALFFLQPRLVFRQEQFLPIQRPPQPHPLNRLPSFHPVLMAAFLSHPLHPPSLLLP